jgi:replicative DNA helicase
MMSDLRESGSIEQDADLIMLLYRDHYYNEESPEKNLLEINITKQRNGAIGTILLQYEKEYNLVRNLSRR